MLTPQIILLNNSGMTLLQSGQQHWIQLVISIAFLSDQHFLLRPSALKWRNVLLQFFYFKQLLIQQTSTRKGKCYALSQAFPTLSNK